MLILQMQFCNSIINLYTIFTLDSIQVLGICQHVEPN